MQRIRFRSRAGQALLLLAGLLAPLAPRGARAEEMTLAGVRVNVIERKLDNGLTLLMLENHQSPTVGMVLGFSVGSVDESDGISGAAHILEHMLFKGTPEIGTTDWAKEKVLLDQIEVTAQELRAERNREGRGDPERLKALADRIETLQKEARGFLVSNEADRIYNEAGQQGFNAGTSWDMTSYQIALPSNRLELWMKLESDRLKTPVLREFYTELNNIMEERRLRTEDSPAGPLGKVSEAVIVAAYQAHRYGVPIIGWPADIARVTRTEVEAFYRTYYAPNRMTVAIVGDIDPVRTYDMVKAYFGDLKRQPDPWKPRTDEPKQIGERRVEVEYDAEPRVILAWHVPAADHRDWPAIEVMNEVLQGGRSSRLQRRVIEEKKIAASINGYTGIPGGRYASLYMIEATPLSPHSTTDVEEAIYTEMERLKKEPPTEAEVRAVQTRYRKGFVDGLVDNLGLANSLAGAAATFGDWRQPFQMAEAIMRVTPADVQRVAATYLAKRNRTVGTLVKPEPEAAIVDPAAEAQAKALLERARTLLGGPRALGAFADLRATRKTLITTPQGSLESASTELMTTDGRFKSEMSIMGQTMTVVLTGNSGWMKTPQGVMDAPAETVADVRSDYLPQLFFLTLDPARIGGATFRPLEQGVLNGTPTSAVEVAPIEGKPFVVHFDPKTSRPLGLSADGKNPVTGESGRIDRVYSEYKPFGGLQLPTRRQDYMGGQMISDETTTGAQVNTGVKPEEFSKPS